MATFYVTEYRTISATSQVPQEPPLREQTISISGTAAQSAPFSVGCRLIRMHTDSICSKLLGTNPTATTSSGRMAANQTEYTGVVDGMIVSVIANT